MITFENTAPDKPIRKPLLSVPPETVVIPPRDPETRIWRYMDFTKYISMLENKALFFSRSDLLDDPFEGSYPRENIQRRVETWGGGESNWTEDYIKQLFEDFREQRAYLLLNCWHMNNEESAAMWKLYAKSNEAIAIQSTYSRLRCTLPPKVQIGQVQYIDYDQDSIPEGNLFNPLMHKRKSFEHERELRAILWLISFRDDAPVDGRFPPPPDVGVSLPVDLDHLIEAVYIAPKSPEWFYELVKKITLKYDLKKPVFMSKLDEKPAF